MDFKLEISRNNSSYFPVDLFPNSELEYDLNFYDNLEIDKIKLPFSSNIRVPLTDTNKDSVRFDYDPDLSPAADFPIDDFFFKLTIYGSSNTIIQGILNVSSYEYNSGEPYIDVELQDFVSKYIKDLKNTRLHQIYDENTGTYGTYFRTNQTFTTFFDLDANGGERGTVNLAPAQKPIIFPYIDFVNDVHGKFGYAARQFTEYGVGLDRAGIVPVFNVKEFLEHIGIYLSAQGFNTRVDSSLFAQNLTEHIPDFEAEKLNFMVPAKLEAEVDINTRTFDLNQAPFWTGTNEEMYTKFKTSDPTVEKDFVTNWFEGNETFGNYGPDAEGGEQSFSSIYGVDIRDAAYPENEVFGYERGYFAPHMSFHAAISWRSGNNFANVRSIQLEIPLVNEDNMTQNINVVESTMNFGLFIGIYEDGVMVKKLRLQDFNGADISLRASDARAIAGNSEKVSHSSSDPHQFFTDINTAQYVILDDPLQIGYTDMLEWDLSALGLANQYLPEDNEITINGESRYGVNYFLEPLDGQLRVSYTTNVSKDSSTCYHADTLTTQDVSISSLRKLITRTVDYGQFSLDITANKNFNPYFTSDQYNLRTSLQNTCETSVYDVLLGLCKRFNCGIFYEYDTLNSINVLRIDPLSIVRSGSEDINQYVDDLKSVKVFVGGDKIKNLSLSNEDYGLYYDDEDGDKITIGSTTQSLNNDGVSDLEIKFKSTIYYRSVCGDKTDAPINQNYVNGVVSQQEISFTPNLFTPYTELGLRFAYVDRPKYITLLKRPLAVSKFQRPNLYTKTQRIYQFWAEHVFNGVLRHVNNQGWNLLAEDEDGNTTEYYDFYIEDEKIKHSNSPSIEFDMVVPTSQLSTLDFMLKEFNATTINQNSIVVKSAEGEVFENYAYLTIKGLLK